MTVPAICSTIVLSESFFLGDFFGDERDGGFRLQRDLEGDVRRRASHQFDEVPVFERRSGVFENVADHLAVNFRGGVEAERNGQEIADLEIAVDRLGDADHLNTRSVGLDVAEQVFGQGGGVGVRIVAADDYDGIDLVLDAHGLDRRELFRALNFRTVGAEQVETASIDDGIDVRIRELGHAALE